MDIAMLEIILYKSNLILQAEGRILCSKNYEHRKTVVTNGSASVEVTMNYTNYSAGYSVFFKI